jgi:hypothetical protein
VKVGRVESEWYGMSVNERVKRATGRSLVGMAVRVATETKMVTHVVSGTLRRSVHAAPVHYEGAELDRLAAEGGQDLLEGDLMGLEPTWTPIGPALEVGSWMPYACVEWVGRGHPGVTQGLELARSSFDGIIVQAFREEGLA